MRKKLVKIALYTIAGPFVAISFALVQSIKPR